MKNFLILVSLLAVFPAPVLTAKPARLPAKGANMVQANDSIILGGGCFWCVQAAFELVPGVSRITVGYAGGHVANPSYEQVCAETTGHIEVAKIEYDPGKVSLDHLLDIFWKIHDPTSLDRQGADAGYQYHSIIYYGSDAARKTAEASIKAAQARYPRPIVTEVKPAPVFWPAEDYHQEYFKKNPNAGYCQAVIAPKLLKAGLTK